MTAILLPIYHITQILLGGGMVFLMSFLAFLRQSGFTVLLKGDLVDISPKSLLMPGQLDYLKANKRLIVKELELEMKTGIKLE